jgi:hypothetical protein
MENSHLTAAEGKLKSDEIFSTTKVTNPEWQHSHLESVYGHTKQNVGKVNIYSGQFGSNQSGVIDYIPEQKVYENATLSTSHFSSTPTNGTHQIEVPGKLHRKEELKLHRQQGDRDADVLEVHVESATQEHTILTQNHSLYSNERGEYKLSSTVEYSADKSGESDSGPYNTESVLRGHDTKQMAVASSRRKDDASHLVPGHKPVHENITTQQNEDLYVRHFPRVMYASNLSNSRYLYSTLSSESHTRQDQVSEFLPSESVVSTPLSANSHAPMLYSQPNSGQEHASRMHSSPAFRWKNQWTMKGWLL